MRHKKLGRRFNRDSGHRQAMFSNMAGAAHPARADRDDAAEGQDLQRVVDKYITLAKRGDLSSRRLAAVACATRTWPEALRHARPLLQGARGRLHAC